MRKRKLASYILGLLGVVLFCTGCLAITAKIAWLLLTLAHITTIVAADLILFGLLILGLAVALDEK